MIQKQTFYILKELHFIENTLLEYIFDMLKNYSLSKAVNISTNTQTSYVALEVGFWNHYKMKNKKATQQLGKTFKMNNFAHKCAIKWMESAKCNLKHINTKDLSWDNWKHIKMLLQRFKSMDTVIYSFHWCKQSLNT